MKANVEVIRYGAEPLKDGTLSCNAPSYERPQRPKDRKRKAIALGPSRYERFRDFSNNKPDRDCLDKEQIE